MKNIHSFLVFIFLLFLNSTPYAEPSVTLTPLIGQQQYPCQYSDQKGRENCTNENVTLTPTTAVGTSGSFAYQFYLNQNESSCYSPTVTYQMTYTGFDNTSGQKFVLNISEVEGLKITTAPNSYSDKIILDPNDPNSFPQYITFNGHGYDCASGHAFIHLKAFSQ